jgi:hypothetical protein
MATTPTTHRSSARKFSGKVNHGSSCPLVLIEWEDSAQPIPSWHFLTDFEAPNNIRCASVGWLIHDSPEKMVLAPNFGGISDASSAQVSGMIQIPTRCILKLTHLREPRLTSFVPVSDPAPRPRRPKCGLAPE